MFIDKKTQYYQDVSASQINLWIQNSPNQNPSKLCCVYQQTDSKGDIERQKTQNTQCNIKAQNWGTDPTWL